MVRMLGRPTYFVPPGVRQKRVSLDGQLDRCLLTRFPTRLRWCDLSSFFSDPFHALAYVAYVLPAVKCNL